MTTTAPPPAEQTARQTPLTRAYAAREAAEAAWRERSQEVSALERERDQLGLQLARDGKLTRAGRGELARVKRDLTKAERERTKAYAKLDKVETRHTALMEREAARTRAKQERENAKQRDRDRAAAERLEQRSMAKACFAKLPPGAKPSLAATQPQRGVYETGGKAQQHGLLVREGRGQNARWVIVTTDGNRLVRTPLTVATDKAVKHGVLIPPEALKAIEKAGSFRIAKGAIQPLKVEHRYQGYDQTAYVTRYEYVARPEGPAYVIPSARDVGKFPEFAKWLPKPPAKKNTLEIRVDSELLAKTAKALGDNRVTLRIDLSKTGKAAAGRKVTTPFTVEPVKGESDGLLGPVNPNAV